MTDYKKLYFTLFNGISDVTEQLEQFKALLIETQFDEEKLSQLEQSISNLKQVQIETEEVLLSQEEE